MYANRALQSRFVRSYQFQGTSTRQTPSQNPFQTNLPRRLRDETSRLRTPRYKAREHSHWLRLQSKTLRFRILTENWNSCYEAFRYGRLYGPRSNRSTHLQLRGGKRRYFQSWRSTFHNVLWTTSILNSLQQKRHLLRAHCKEPTKLFQSASDNKASVQKKSY